MCCYRYHSQAKQAAIDLGQHHKVATILSREHVIALGPRVICMTVVVVRQMEGGLTCNLHNISRHKLAGWHYVQPAFPQHCRHISLSSTCIRFDNFARDACTNAISALKADMSFYTA